ncbi:hypothetical protein [Corallococcus sicarius]|uniref:hypothetical protein n=1 Tax=Corallococcus sicarius TaxID=2316726 RepID=UPI001ABFF268|nr:hypothetical protein [Corallococcus sicarius]
MADVRPQALRHVIGRTVTSDPARRWPNGYIAPSSRTLSVRPQAIRHVVGRTVTFLRTEYQMRLMPLFGDAEAIFDYDSPVPADREHQLRVMSTMPEAFSYDEWREVEGFKPDPNRHGYPLPMPGQTPGELHAQASGKDAQE